MAFPKYLEDNREIITDNLYNTIRTNLFDDCSYNKKANETSAKSTAGVSSCTNKKTK